MVAVLAICLCIPAFSATSNLQGGGSAGPGDIGDFGTWATDNNRQAFIEQFSSDLNNYRDQAKKNINTVPIEAKVGLSFMNAFSMIAKILDSSLVRFVTLFIMIMFGFWMALEADTVISGQNNAKEKFTDIAKKGFKAALWVSILLYGPVEVFMMVVTPILQLSSSFSNLILESTDVILKTEIYDSCAAITEHVKNNISEYNLLKDPKIAASIMCVPTKISSFSYTAISVGWDWMGYGIGNSFFAFLCGAGLVIGFIYLAWQFAFIAFGVIADLFLSVIMLPFTAVSESVYQTTHKGIVGNIYNGFVKLFSAESLKAQFERFVNAALHFVVLSIVIAICTTLLSGIITVDTVNMAPDISNQNVWVIMLVSALTWWLAKNASNIANDLGGAISTEFGTNIQNDIKTLWEDTKKNAKSWYKVIKSS